MNREKQYYDIDLLLEEVFPIHKHKKPNRYFLFFVGSFVLLSLAGAVFYFQWYRYKNNKLPNCTYSNFGVPLPPYTSRGIDVSSYQDAINWKLVKNMAIKGDKIDFAIIRATMGSDRKDKNFTTNWKETKNNQLIRGAYHYFDPTEDAAQQAIHYTNTVHWKTGDIHPILDAEDNKGYPTAAYQQKVKIWLDIVERKTGKKPILYASSYFIRDYLNLFQNYPIWVANYNGSPQMFDDTPWILWQHTDRSTINGIKNRTDLNVVNGDIRLLQQKYCF